MNIRNNSVDLISEILFRHDPIKLIQGGAPKDEYSLEVNQIVELVKQSLNGSDLAGKLYSLYNQLFSNSEVVGEKQIYEKIAKEIYDKVVVND